MPLDVQAARSAGYSDAEIADEMAKDSAFDTAGARSAGYSDAEIIAELSTAPQPSGPVDQPAQQPINTPERRALVEELGKRTASAEDAGKRLSRLETVEKFARPVLSTLTNIADAQPIVALPRLLANAGVEAVNLVGGTQIPGLQEITPPSLRPRNNAEALTASLTRGIAGAGGGVAVGQQLATSGANLGSNYLANLGGSLAANPALQAAGGASGGVASEVARREGAGPLVQTLAGVAGGLAPAAGLGAVNKVATGVTRTPQAQRLLDRGVDLTPGQLNAAGAKNQFEEAIQSTKVIGPQVANARQNARETFQRVAIQEGAAPGTQIAQADPAVMLQQASDSFTPLYDAAKGFPASAQIVNPGANIPLARALKDAIRSKSIIASKGQRKDVLAYVEDQLTKGVRSSDDLINIRSSIRDKQRSAANSQNQEEKAELLAAADDVLTQALDSQLPPDALRSLRTADSKYRDYKTVERAVARAKDRAGRGDFTPNDLSEAIAQASRGSNAGGYARGGGGPLREIAADARAVLDARSPPTGARLLTVGAGPAAVVGAFDPTLGAATLGTQIGASYLGATTQAGRRLAAGTTATQRAILQQLQQRGLTNLPVNYRNALVGGAFNYGAQNLTPTAQLVRDMIGIPQPPILGRDQQEDENLRAGLFQ